MAFKNRICTTKKNAVPMCKPICCFTSRQMFSTSKKDALSAEKISNVIYLFTCECGHTYVGKATQRMEERVKQHVSNELVKHVVQPDGNITLRRRPGRPRKSAGEQKLDTGGIAGAKSDTSITKHWKASPACLQAVCRDHISPFRIVAQGRSKAHPNSLGVIFIAHT